MKSNVSLYVIVGYVAFDWNPLTHCMYWFPEFYEPKEMLLFAVFCTIWFWKPDLGEVVMKTMTDTEDRTEPPAGKLGSGGLGSLPEGTYSTAWKLGTFTKDTTRRRA